MQIYQDSNGEHWLDFYWDDLTPQAQAEVVKALGDNGQFDIYPIGSVPISRKWILEHKGYAQ